MSSAFRELEQSGSWILTSVRFMFGRINGLNPHMFQRYLHASVYILALPIFGSPAELKISELSHLYDNHVFYNTTMSPESIYRSEPLSILPAENVGSM